MIPAPSFDLVGGTDAHEHDALIAVAHDFAQNELKPRSSELDRQDPAAIDWSWSAISELGFDRAVLPEQLGGAAIGLSGLLGAIEEFATGDAGVAALVLLSNVAVCALPASTIDTMAAGERWTVALPASALMKRPPYEFVAGSTLKISADEGAFELSGGLAFVAAAADAAGVAVLSGKAPCALPLRNSEHGTKVLGRADQMGLRAAIAAEVGVKDVRFEADDLAPAILHPLYAATLLRLGYAAIARGIQRAALETAIEYATARRQGGITIVHHGAVRELLSNIAAPLDAGCPVQWPVQGRTKLGSALIRAGLAAKIEHTDAAVIATTDAVQVFGGTGYMVETGVEKLMRDAKYCQLLPEPNWRARELLMQETGHPRPE